MSEASRGISRRTLVKGTAWAVPAVAVASAAPAYAVSKLPPPPPPVFNWGAGCATVGNGKGGCNGNDKTPQVPVYASNTTSQTLQFQLMGAKFWPDNGTEPANFYAPQIWTNNGTEDGCGPQVTTTGCGGYLTVTLAPGACVDLWLVQPESLNNSSSFWAKFQYRWATPPVPGTPPTGCEIVGLASYTATAPQVISSNNCDGSTVTTSCGSTNRRQTSQVTSTTTTSSLEATSTTTTSTTQEPTTTTSTTEEPTTSTSTTVEASSEG